MKARMSMLTAALLLLSAMICSKVASAADFSLAWDPNCNVDPTLVGYTIYYSADSPVTIDPESADIIFISLDDPDFNPEQPTYKVSGLQDNVEYYFTVSAVYKGGESDMSNEISGIRGDSLTSPDSRSAGAGGGCFINALIDS